MEVNVVIVCFCIPCITYLFIYLGFYPKMAQRIFQPRLWEAFLRSGTSCFCFRFHPIRPKFDTIFGRGKKAHRLMSRFPVSGSCKFSGSKIAAGNQLTQMESQY